MLLGDRIYKLYKQYMRGELEDVTPEEKEFFDRYTKKKQSGFTFMEAEEFECILKYDKEK